MSRERVHSPVVLSELGRALNSAMKGEFGDMIEALSRAIEANPTLAQAPEIAQAFQAGADLANKGEVSDETRSFMAMMAEAQPAAEGTKMLREALGLTTAAAAELTGFSESYVSKWEAGTRPVPPAAIGALLRAIAEKGIDLVEATAEVQNRPIVTGRDVLRLRKALKMSQKEIATLFGITQKVISEIERFDRKVSHTRVEILRDLARSRGVDFPLAA
jgi:transcriptional regulator with XRE-family HTH domain